MTQLDQLLNSSLSQHGYWLINHKSVILGDMMELLEKQGLQQAILTVNDLKSNFGKAVYKKIDEHREKTYAKR